MLMAIQRVTVRTFLHMLEQAQIATVGTITAAVKLYSKLME
jgi:hypothetical protein